MRLVAADLVIEFDVLASDLSIAKKKVKKGERARRCLSRGHARNVLKKRQIRATKESPTQGQPRVNSSIHRSKRKSAEASSVLDLSSLKMSRMKEILTELEHLSFGSLVVLMEKYPRIEFTKDISSRIVRLLSQSNMAELCSVRNDIHEMLGRAISRASSLHLVRQCVTILLDSGNGSLPLICEVIQKVSQRKQRAILGVITQFAKTCPKQEWLNTLFNVGALVCKSTKKATTKLAALKLISYCDYADRSVELIISELRGAKPRVRKFSVDILCHKRRGQRAVAPLLRAIKDESSKSDSRILFKAFARVGVSILELNRVDDIVRLAEVVSVSPLFDVLVSKSVEGTEVCTMPMEVRSFTARILELSQSLRPVGRLGVLSGVSRGKITGFNLSS